MEIEYSDLLVEFRDIPMGGAFFRYGTRHVYVRIDPGGIHNSPPRAVCLSDGTLLHIGLRDAVTALPAAKVVIDQ